MAAFAAFSGVGAQTGPTTASTPRTITAPEWLQKPSGSDIARLYPRKAIRADMNGSATIQCGVTGEGKLQGCEVVAEDPRDFGFGAAALALAPKFRLAKTMDGASVEGGMVRVPIIFRIYGGKSNVALATNPAWRATASRSEVARAYPPEAGDLDEGSAVIRCAFQDDGRTRNCMIISQSPADKGFGAAAKALASKFVVDPTGLPPLPILLADIPFTLRNPARPSKEPTLTPQWLVGLSPSGAARIFPQAARDAGVTSGLGVVNCAASADGKLTDCQVRREEPAGVGFGAAGLEAAQLMSMNPWTAAGEPVEGRRLNLPIRLKLENTVAPASP